MRRFLIIGSFVITTALSTYLSMTDVDFRRGLGYDSKQLMRGDKVELVNQWYGEQPLICKDVTYIAGQATERSNKVFLLLRDCSWPYSLKGENPTVEIFNLEDIRKL